VVRYSFDVKLLSSSPSRRFIPALSVLPASVHEIAVVAGGSLPSEVEDGSCDKERNSRSRRRWRSQARYRGMAVDAHQSVVGCLNGCGRSAAALGRTTAFTGTARALHVSYESLKHRVVSGTGGRQADTNEADCGSVCRVAPVPFATTPAPARGPEVELVGVQGERMVIRLAANQHWICRHWPKAFQSRGHDPDHAADAGAGGGGAGGFRRGIDGLARVCRETLGADPFGGAVFVFRSRRGSAIKLLVYDGQGFWLCHKATVAGTVPLVAVAGRQRRHIPARARVAGFALWWRPGLDQGGAGVARDRGCWLMGRVEI